MSGAVPVRLPPAFPMKHLRIERTPQQQLGIKPVRASRQLQDICSSVSSVALSADGKWAVSCLSMEKEWCAWDVAKGKRLWSKTAPEDWAAHVHLGANDRRLLSTGRSICLWSFPGGELIRRWDGLIFPSAFSGDGRRLAAVRSGDPVTLVVADAESGRTVWESSEFSVQIADAALDFTGSRVAVTDHDGVRVIELPSGRRLWSHLRKPEPYRSYPCSKPRFRADGRLLAVVDGFSTVRFLDTETWRDEAPVNIQVPGTVIHSLAFDRDWNRVFVGEAQAYRSEGQDQAISVWHREADRCFMAGELEGHPRAVYALAAGAEGKTVISGDEHGVIKVWKPGTRTFRKPFKKYLAGPVHEIALMRSGGQAVTVEKDGAGKIWNARDGSLIRELKPAGLSCLHGAHYSPDETAIRFSGMNEFAEHVLGEIPARDGETPFRSRVERRPEAWWRWVKGAYATFHQDEAGDILYDEGGAVRRLAGGRSRFTDLTAGPGGILAAGADSGDVHVWQGTSDTPRFILKGHQGAILSVELQETGGTLLAISAGKDGSARIWDLATGECRHVLKQMQPVCGAVLTESGDIAVTAGWNCTIRLWYLENGECFHVHHAGEPISCLSRIGRANRIACGTWRGDVLFLTLRTEVRDTGGKSS